MRYFMLILFCCYWWKTSCQYYSPQMLNEQKECPWLPKDFSLSYVKQAFTPRNEAADEDEDEQTEEPVSSPLFIPADRHLIFQRSSERSKLLNSEQMVFEEATRKLLKKVPSLTSENINNGLANLDLEKIVPGNIVTDCINLLNFVCDPDSKYRTFDGSCNNLQNPTWGMATACTQRFLPASYSDGISKLRLAKSGADLPTPRTVSLHIHSNLDKPSNLWTDMFWQWGQFIAHDMINSPFQSGHFNCCGEDINNTQSCGPILIEEDDPFYSKHGIRCLPNIRTAACATCMLGPRQQINQKTSFIDGSLIYGVSKEECDDLRDFNGKGTLKSTHHPAGELLPYSTNPHTDECSFQVPNLKCFIAGDQRVNQHLVLTSVHTGWLRYHNRIARRLHALNKCWDDDRVFEETRRVIIALLQSITYQEFLLEFIGEERMQYFKLNVQKGFKYTKYDSTANPTTWNEFNTAAYRSGHSLVIYPSSPDPNDRLLNNFAWPFNLYSKGNMESITQNICLAPQQKFDRHVIDDLTNHLYALRGNETGLDLASLNVFRGRDHGIPPYVDLVKFCGGPDITTFEQLKILFQENYVPLFEKVYENVEDIDFWTGGLAEQVIPGAVLGPTFACIVGIQFHHLKYGDRFYFEHKNQVGSFTPGQLRAIKRITLANVICRYTKINSLPEKVLLPLSPENRMKSCKSLRDIDLRPWKEHCRY